MEYSYYPVMFGIGFLGMDFSMVLFMDFGMMFSLLSCLFYIMFVSVLWSKDVSLEDVSGQYSFNDCDMFRQGFRLFLFSELALFFCVFWTFFDFSLCPLVWVGDEWFPFGILSPDYIGVNGVASLFLMMNSQLLKYSRRFLCMNLIKCEYVLLLCIFIGSFFLCYQYFEYCNNCFVMNDSVYGNVFYIGTGLHGMHVFIGVLFLIYNFFRIKASSVNWYHVQSYDMCIDYWRFLEWIWGVMFVLFYVWGS